MNMLRIAFGAASNFGALTAAAVSALVLSGCTNLLTPIGHNTYDCNRKENPASQFCHSFKAVEASTSGPLPDSRYDETLRIGDVDKMTGIAPTGGKVPERLPPRAEPGAVGAIGTGEFRPFNTAASLEGLPVRLGPMVQRVWIKRFVDANDLLVGDTVIYKEIMGSRWSGFEVADPARASAMSGGRAISSNAGIYPHRPPTVASGVMKALDGASSTSNPSRDASRPSRPEFNQPGAKASESGGLATVPAIESGTTSMPQ